MKCEDCPLSCEEIKNGALVPVCLFDLTHDNQRCDEFIESMKEAILRKNSR